jgi:uncharacterized Fe-S cluster-containing protein
LFDSDDNVVVSVAPSFASVYEDWEQRRLPSALRELGFTYVMETSIGAKVVAKKSADIINENPNKNHICSSCPAVVNYIEKYKHGLISAVIPVVSPMIAHAKIIKKKYGRKTKVVFLGPCIAKKDEASRNEYARLVDAVLTFEELQVLFENKNISLSQCEESNFDEVATKNAKLFPLEGGLLKTADIDTDILSDNIIAVSGFEQIEDAILNISEYEKAFVIEPLFCKSGCINGPILPFKRNNFEKRQSVIKYSGSSSHVDNSELDIDVKANYRYNILKYRTDFSDEEISEVFSETGKSNPENQLNCGACGYKNCRENAIAVLQEIAEPEMCIPYMRRLAEQKSDSLIQADPNGIVILDEKLQITGINPAFKNMFTCTDAIIGKHVSYMIDQDPFEKLIANPDDVIKKVIKYPSYNLVCHQIHYAIPEENHYIGIFVDITNLQQNENKLTRLKSETVIQAQELIEHQIGMAQQMAKFLGENTAKGEMLMNKLIKVIDDNK